MITNEHIEQLKNIVEKVDYSLIPYKKGNSIRIGKLVIRKSKQGYFIFDVTENRRIAIFYSKDGALAFAKNYENRRNCEDIVNIDRRFEKFHVDSLFYKHTIDTATDEIKLTNAENRLDIAIQEVYNAKSKYTIFVFS